jgi:coenzyme F420-reducing hydrogenase delta subunit
MSEPDNVVILPVVTRLNIPPDRVLNDALAADLDGVVVIGQRKDGSYYFSSSIADGGDVLWQLEWAKAALMRAGGLLVEK